MIIKINCLATALLAMSVWGGGVYGANKNDLHSMQDAEQGPKDKPDARSISRFNARRALFEVTKGIYQIHGNGFPNITIMEGQEGIMIITPFVPEEIMTESLDLYYRKAGKRIVKAIVHTPPISTILPMPEE